MEFSDPQFEIADNEFVFGWGSRALHLIFSGGELLEGAGELAWYNINRATVVVRVAKSQSGVTYRVIEKEEDSFGCASLGNSLYDTIKSCKQGAHSENNIETDEITRYGFDNGMELLPHARNDQASGNSIIDSETKIEEICRKEEDASFSTEHFWCDELGGCDNDGTSEIHRAIKEYIPWYILHQQPDTCPSREFLSHSLPILEDTEYDVSKHLKSVVNLLTSQIPECDPLTSILPAAEDEILWRGNVDILSSTGKGTNEEIGPRSSNLQAHSKPKKDDMVELLSSKDFDEKHHFSKYLNVVMPCRKSEGYKPGSVLHPLSLQIVWTNEEENIILSLLQQKKVWDIYFDFGNSTKSILQARSAMLVDVLIATVYEDIIACGENTLQSAWTIRTLSTSISHNRKCSTLLRVVNASGRRCLTLPAVRSFSLFSRSLHALCIILQQGTVSVTRLLVRAYKLLSHEECPHISVPTIVVPLLLWIGYFTPTEAFQKLQHVGNLPPVVMDKYLLGIAQEVHDVLPKISIESIGLQV